MGHQGSLNALVYSLVMLAVLLGVIAGWQRYTQRRRFEPIPQLGVRVWGFGFAQRTPSPDIRHPSPEARHPKPEKKVGARHAVPLLVGRPGTGSTPSPITIQADAVRPHGDRGPCTNCHTVLRSGALVLNPAFTAQNNPKHRRSGPRPDAHLIVGSRTRPTPTPELLSSSTASPRQQNAAGKELFEGHWLGLEVIPLIPQLAAVYQVPKGESGVLVDEITLEGAESGVLAGDMIHSIDGRPTSDLRAFFLATQHVQEKERAELGVSRRGSKMAFVVEARNTKILGFAQMEAAQPIKPGAISPHRSRGRPGAKLLSRRLDGRLLESQVGRRPTCHRARVIRRAIQRHGELLDRREVAVDAVPAPVGTVENVLHQIALDRNAEFLLTDLRPARDDADGAWLRELRPTRLIGYAAFDFDWEQMVVIPHVFDALLFVDHATASKLLPRRRAEN